MTTFVVAATDRSTHGDGGVIFYRVEAKNAQEAIAKVIPIFVNDGGTRSLDHDDNDTDGNYDDDGSSESELENLSESFGGSLKSGQACFSLSIYDVSTLDVMRRVE